MEALLALLFVVLVAAFVAVPLRRSGGEVAGAEDPRQAELEARKEAKYREIRDAELDRAAGKLSEADFRIQDAELRREAIEILRELDRVVGADGQGEPHEAVSGGRGTGGEVDRRGAAGG